MDLRSPATERAGSWAAQRLSSPRVSTSKTEHIGAGAHCVASDAFVNSNDSSPGWERWLYEASLSAISTGTKKTTMSAKKYAAALTGLEGRVMTESPGSAEEFAKTQSGSSNRELKIKTDESYKLTAWGLSWGLDNPGSDPDFKSQAQVTSGGQRTMQLAQTDVAMCYLKRIRGELNGTGESVRLVRRDGWWILSVKGACESRSGFMGLGDDCSEYVPVKATARCYNYQQ